MKVELIPVLEVPITSEARRQVPAHPHGDFQQNPVEWDEYQRQLLSAGGFADYPRVIPGSNFVHIDQWSLPDLRRLVANHLGDNNQLIDFSESVALYGGFILFVENVPVLVPQCCSTIYDFLSWKELLSSEFISGPFCLEGHPGPTAVKSGNQLLITCEDEWESFDQPTQLQIVVDLSELTNAVVQAEQHIDGFAEKLDLLSAEFGVVKASDYLVWAKS